VTKCSGKRQVQPMTNELALLAHLSVSRQLNCVSSVKFSLVTSLCMHF